MLVVDGYTFPRDALSKWIGNELECIAICDFTDHKKAPGLICNADLILILKKSRYALRSIVLKSVSTRLEGLIRNTSPSFPNLQTLSLQGATSSILQFFASSNCPNISILEIAHSSKA